MCGIGGVVGALDVDAVNNALRRMTSAMTHRGPDDSGLHVSATGSTVCGLCATRLAIMDCSPAGHQPMVSERSGSVLTLNGEIYNAGNLRRILEGLGYAFRGGSDTEVALAAFDEWGRACVHRLQGMFAMCIWDASNRQTLLVRDRLGIKPLYYFVGGQATVFASEIRALLSTGLVPNRLSIPGVESFLTLGAVREPETIIEGVCALEPGNWASIGDGVIDIEQYWALEEAFRAPSELAGRQMTVKALRQHLEAVVSRHLVSDVPLGIFLSGGIDSSALVALASQVSGEPPKTVSVVFPETELSEDVYIRMMVDRYRTDHSQLMLDHSQFLNDLPGAITAMDQPTVDGVNTYVVSKAARAAGLTVALSGLGGDELFAGYDSFRSVPRLDELRRWLPRPMRIPVARAAAMVYGSSDRSRKLCRWLRASDPGLSAYELQRELFSPDARERLLPSVPSANYSNAARLSDAVNDVSLLELETYMRNVLLRDSDVMSMANSLELRVPFLDEELVEFVAGLPGAWKVDGPRPKSLLVEAVADLLPRAVYDRKKMGFTLPFSTWMKGGLRQEIETTLFGNRATGGFVDVLDAEAVRDVWGMFLSGQAQWSRAWAIYVLTTWCDRNLTNPSRPAV